LLFLKGEMILESAINKGVSVVLTFKMRTLSIILDDEVLFRKGISFLLGREANIDIIFEASNGRI
jgi:hypothetical protein